MISVDILLLQHLVSYPVSQDKLVNFVALTAEPFGDPIAYDGPTATPCTPEEVQSVFKLWEPETQSLFQVTPFLFLPQCTQLILAPSKCMEKPIKWIIRCQLPLDHYALGRVALGGDAVRYV